MRKVWFWVYPCRHYPHQEQFELGMTGGGPLRLGLRDIGRTVTVDSSIDDFIKRF